MTRVRSVQSNAPSTVHMKAPDVTSMTDRVKTDGYQNLPRLSAKAVRLNLSEVWSLGEFFRLAAAASAGSE